MSLPSEMGAIAQTFMSETELLRQLKCWTTSLSTLLFLTERRCSANLSNSRRPYSFTDIQFKRCNK